MSLKARSPPAGANNEREENNHTLARIYKDHAPALYYDKNLSVRSDIEKCPIADFPQILSRLPNRLQSEKKVL